PACLTLLGRRAFWPRIPRTSEPSEGPAGATGGKADGVAPAGLCPGPPAVARGRRHGARARRARRRAARTGPVAGRREPVRDQAGIGGGVRAGGAAVPGPGRPAADGPRAAGATVRRPRDGGGDAGSAAGGTGTGRCVLGRD